MAKRAHALLNAQRASSLLKSMCNEHRLLILCQLVPGEKTVSELQEVSGQRQTAVSQHLARLRKDDLVETRRDGKNIYYSLSGKEVSTVLETLYSLYCDTEATLTLNAESENAKVVSLQ
jgi:ArsR family transcriptional regulator, virulence genes transcriptional regulator